MDVMIIGMLEGIHIYKIWIKVLSYLKMKLEIINIFYEAENHHKSLLHIHK